MKIILNNFYIFSKLAFSLILLICLIVALYILYINYKNESIISQTQNISEIQLEKSINNNSNLINKLIDGIKMNETALISINEKINLISSQDSDNKISVINDDIQILKKSLQSLSKEIQNLKSQNISSSPTKEVNKPKIINDSKNEIIDLIFLKYENNFDFTKELEYLKNVLDNDKLANVDKLSILSIDGFKGHEYLKNTFENEVNIYLKKIVNKKPNSFFSRIFFPYVEVSPTSENIVTSDIVRKIKVVNLHIENKNIVKALNNLKSIEDYHKIFILSSEEIKKYIKFKNELYELK